MAVTPRAQVLAIAISASLVLVTDIGVTVARSGDDSPSKTAARPSPTATAAPSPSQQAAPAGNVVRAKSFTMELPVGWKAVPLDPKALAPFLAEAARSNPQLASALRNQTKALSSQKFDLFAVNQRSGSDFAENVNVIVVNQAAPLDALLGGAEQAMKAFGATETTVKQIQLSQGPVVESTYSLRLGTVTVAGVQHYLVIGSKTYIITYSSLERSLSRDRAMTGSITPS